MPNARARTVPYNRQPIKISPSGIPIFADSTDYIENYDAIARKHVSTLDQSGENPFMSERTWSIIDASTLEILQSIVRPEDKLFDAGVGLGALLSGFPDNERYGVDVSLEYLERTAASGVNVALAVLEDIPFEDEVFDVVMSTDVLEHVEDFHRATKEMTRILKPGGYMVIRVPLEEDMKAYYDYDEFKFVHLRRFDIWSIRLHFERILGLQYVSEARVLPYYRGVSTSRMRPVECGDRIRAILGRLPDGLPGLREFKSFTELTVPDFESFMNNIAVNHSAIFAELVEEVAGYLEINVVFRKVF